MSDPSSHSQAFYNKYKSLFYPPPPDESSKQTSDEYSKFLEERKQITMLVDDYYPLPVEDSKPFHSEEQRFNAEATSTQYINNSTPQFAQEFQKTEYSAAPLPQYQPKIELTQRSPRYQSTNSRSHMNSSRVSPKSLLFQQKHKNRLKGGKHQPKQSQNSWVDQIEVQRQIFREKESKPQDTLQKKQHPPPHNLQRQYYENILAKDKEEQIRLHIQNETKRLSRWERSQLVPGAGGAMAISGGEEDKNYHLIDKFSGLSIVNDNGPKREFVPDKETSIVSSGNSQSISRLDIIKKLRNLCQKPIQSFYLSDYPVTVQNRITAYRDLESRRKSLQGILMEERQFCMGKLGVPLDSHAMKVKADNNIRWLSDFSTDSKVNLFRTSAEFSQPIEYEEKRHFGKRFVKRQSIDRVSNSNHQFNYHHNRSNSRRFSRSLGKEIIRKSVAAGNISPRTPGHTGKRHRPLQQGNMKGFASIRAAGTRPGGRIVRLHDTY